MTQHNEGHCLLFSHFKPLEISHTDHRPAVPHHILQSCPTVHVSICQIWPTSYNPAPLMFWYVRCGPHPTTLMFWYVRCGPHPTMLPHCSCFGMSDVAHILQSCPTSQALVSQMWPISYPNVHALVRQMWPTSYNPAPLFMLWYVRCGPYPAVLPHCSCFGTSDVAHILQSCPTVHAWIHQTWPTSYPIVYAWIHQMWPTSYNPAPLFS